jgi:hypothetical protein
MRISFLEGFESAMSMLFAPVKSVHAVEGWGFPDLFGNIQLAHCSGGFAAFNSVYDWRVAFMVFPSGHGMSRVLSQVPNCRMCWSGAARSLL